jgi:hypothetical protein
MKDKIILAAMKQSELYLPKLNEALKDFLKLKQDTTTNRTL